MIRASASEVIVKPSLKQPRGILNPSASAAKFQLARHLSAPDLSFFIEHYWLITWDLRGQEPYVQETLPYPSVHLVFEPGASRVCGVITGKFARRLEGAGQVFGVKFRPGAFYPFLRSPVSRLTDQVIGLQDAFDVAGDALERAIFVQASHERQIELVERFLRTRLPKRDQAIETINRIVDGIIADRAITKVEDVARRFNIGKRTLQRLFSQYVGVSPKWVIKRYRLQEAADQLADGAAADWPKMALDLGYFDQAHFIKDFKMIVGRTPGEYARSLGYDTMTR
jgi:AraC-like DNA-binding protein